MCEWIWELELLKIFLRILSEWFPKHLEIVTHKGTVKRRKSLCRKGLQTLDKVQNTQNANRMLTVFPKSE